MRIIHTSDWHLGGSWNGYDRTEQLFTQVERVCEIVREQNADALLVVGDIFERVSREKLHRITKTLAEKLKPIIAGGCHVVLVPGNHDFREHFQMMQALLEFESHAERVHVVGKPEVLSIGGVQFICLPYPDRILLEKVGVASTGRGADTETRNQSLSNTLSSYIDSLSYSLDPSVPAVLATHIQIYGVKATSETKELTYNEDICLASNFLPTGVSYIALGHIHRCQKIEQHSVPTWYCGSFDRMDMGERDDEKFVLLVDIGKDKRAIVEQIPVEAVRFEKYEIKAGELEEFAAEFSEPQTAFVNLTIECDSNESWAATYGKARKILPPHWQILPKGGVFLGTAARALRNKENPYETVMGFVETRFKDDKDLPDLKIRAGQLVQEVSDAFTKS